MSRFTHRVSPVLVVALTAIWLLLNQTIAPGQLLLGVALSALFAWFGADLRPVHASFRRADRAAGLLLIVLWDILRSNFAVARIVLGLVGKRDVRSGFLDVPLDLRDDHALAVLACIVTATPGTVWAGLSPDRATLTLHVLDLRDEDEWVEMVKRRYERRLMEIFR